MDVTQGFGTGESICVSGGGWELEDIELLTGKKLMLKSYISNTIRLESMLNGV